uniref:Uncharacterized protein n=1 Tax=Pithovirus LCDPAC02 TaxID=2506601 RepID=A0A481YPM7_9VIRU|nr:MAG: hypothetical protein LCDPAC02_02480 [Pithovirus LCDPAC02]
MSIATTDTYDVVNSLGTKSSRSEINSTINTDIIITDIELLNDLKTDQREVETAYEKVSNYFISCDCETLLQYCNVIISYTNKTDAINRLYKNVFLSRLKKYNCFEMDKFGFITKINSIDISAFLNQNDILDQDNVSCIVIMTETCHRNQIQDKLKINLSCHEDCIVIMHNNTFRLTNGILSHIKTSNLNNIPSPNLNINNSNSGFIGLFIFIIFIVLFLIFFGIFYNTESNYE